MSKPVAAAAGRAAEEVRAVEASSVARAEPWRRGVAGVGSGKGREVPAAAAQEGPRGAVEAPRWSRSSNEEEAAWSGGAGPQLGAEAQRKRGGAEGVAEAGRGGDRRRR